MPDDRISPRAGGQQNDPSTRRRGGARYSALRVDVEFIRHLSAVSLGTTGSTTACWSSVSGLTSAYVLVLQSLPSHTRKVTGSIPVGTTRNAEVSSCLVGWPPLAIAFIRQNPPWVDLPLDYLKVRRGTGTAPHSTCGHRRRPETVESGIGDGGGGVVVDELGDETRRHCRGGDAALWLGRATDPELREDPAGRLATSLAGLITQRSQVRILSPLPAEMAPGETTPGAIFMPVGHVFGTY